MSSYVVSRAPQMYGGVQEAWLREVERVVQHTTEELRSAVDGGRNLVELFNETLKTLSNWRAKCAFLTNTPLAEMFGIRRDQYESGIVHTPLTGPYQEYRQRLMDRIVHDISSTCLQNFPAISTFSKISEATTFDSKTSFWKYHIYTWQNRDEWYLPPEYETYQKMCSLCELPCIREEFDELPFTQFITNIDKLKRLKERAPEYYNRLRISKIFCEMQPYCDCFGLALIHVERISQRSGTDIAQNEYMTTVPEIKVVNVIEEMKSSSPIVMMHQDVFRIESSLNEVAQLFKKCMEQNAQDKQALMAAVAEFNYSFSDTMPLVRGSAAVCEVFEQTIYRYHGYRLEYKPHCWVNLEALTTDERTFVDQYPSMISLIKSL